MKFFNFNDYYNHFPPMKKSHALKTKCFEHEKFSDEIVQIATEETLNLIVNDGLKFNILCTPRDIEALCIGYLFCEGFIKDPSEFEMAKYIKGDILIKTNHSVKEFLDLIEIRSSGCAGVRQQYENLKILIDSDMTITPDIIFKGQKAMISDKTIWSISGGTHMSALIRPDSTLAYFAEDIGRHNTIDKVVGKALLAGEDPKDFFLITSGRISAASISKIARAGISIIVSVSTVLAQGMTLADMCGITIIGFSREPAMNIYTHKERIVGL